MITIVDYGLGNLGSVANALKKLGRKFQISTNPSMLKKGDALILPGVGAAGEGMRNLKEKNLDTVIIEEIKREKPFLGICLGMQLLFDFSQEGNVSCLKILKGQVKKFQRERKVPQIGWNRMKFSIFNFQFSKITSKLFQDIPDQSYLYFVNSYYCIPVDKSIILAETEYGEKFPSIIVKNNIVATQFHPEKSGKVGMQFLNNWSSLC